MTYFDKLYPAVAGRSDMIILAVAVAVAPSLLSMGLFKQSSDLQAVNMEGCLFFSRARFDPKRMLMFIFEPVRPKSCGPLAENRLEEDFTSFFAALFLLENLLRCFGSIVISTNLRELNGAKVDLLGRCHGNTTSFQVYL